MTETYYKFLNEKDEWGNPQHLHTLRGKPLIGTSTALKVLAKPLTWWAAGLAVGEMGWLNPKLHDIQKRMESALEAKLRIEEMEPEEYLKLLDKAYRAHASTLKEKAGEGTDMHEELEKYVTRLIQDQDGKPYRMNGYEHKAVELFAEWATQNVKRFIASEAHCYSETLWTGGIIDCAYEDMEGKIVIMDFKSSKEAYTSQFWQCAGYALQVEESGLVDKDGHHYKAPFKVDYYAVFPFGAENPEPKFDHETEKAKEGFRSVLTIHKLLNTNAK